LLEHERIETTRAKAKEIRGIADKMITLGKDGSLHARRRALSFIREKDVVSRLFSDVAERFQNRDGGYTRIIPTRRRPGDAAELVAVELSERAVVVDDDEVEPAEEDVVEEDVEKAS